VDGTTSYDCKNMFADSSGRCARPKDDDKRGRGGVEVGSGPTKRRDFDVIIFDSYPDLFFFVLVL
jgi:hypothetical protein